MDAGRQHAGGKSLLDIAVGIEAGVLGGLLMLLWLILSAPLLGEPWWLYPNLFASTLYGGYTRQGAGMMTLAGAALHLIATGFVGLLNGLLTPGGRLFGLAVAGGWYLLCYLFLWKRIAPMVLVQGSQPLLMAGYFLFGSALGQHTNLVSRIRARSGLRNAEAGL